jgi:hypothetical protein
MSKPISETPGAGSESATQATGNFIRSIIDQDVEAGKHEGRVHTRFPPEPTRKTSDGSASIGRIASSMPPTTLDSSTSGPST